MTLALYSTGRLPAAAGRHPVPEPGAGPAVTYRVPRLGRQHQVRQAGQAGQGTLRAARTQQGHHRDCRQGARGSVKKKGSTRTQKFSFSKTEKRGIYKIVGPSFGKKSRGHFFRCTHTHPSYFFLPRGEFLGNEGFFFF